MNEQTVQASHTNDGGQNHVQAAEPQGQPVILDCEGALLGANGSGQMICLVPRDGTVEKIELTGPPDDPRGLDGVRILRVAVGQNMFPSFANGQEMGKWEDAYGKVAPKDSYLMVSLHNSSAELRAVGGKITLRVQHGAPAPAPSPVAPQAQVPFAMVAPAPAPQVQTAAPAPFAAPQVAGANEVVCYLTREGCRRLIEWIMGTGPALTIYEKGDMVRRIETARRS